MLNLYESTKFSSVRPLENCDEVLCSSTAWKEASCVTVPSLRVSLQGLVTPLPDCLLLITLAVRRNCLICSLVRVGSSAALTERGQIRETIAMTSKPMRCKRSTYMGVLPLFVVTNLPPSGSFGNDPQAYECKIGRASCRERVLMKA